MNSRRFTIMLLLLAGVIFFISGNKVMGIEEPSYKVLKKDGAIELRQYDSFLIAETVVEGSFGEAGNKAFRRLFNYISGDNRSQGKIKMTAPVNMEPDMVVESTDTSSSVEGVDSEKIKMTAPVLQELSSGDKWRVSFVMPEKYTMETLPEPLDPTVELKEVPGRMVAVFRYSGRWTEKKYESNKAKLEEWIELEGLEAVSLPILARYDPPFKPAFLRRNEVVIPVRELLVEE